MVIWEQQKFVPIFEPPRPPSFSDSLAAVLQCMGEMGEAVSQVLSLLSESSSHVATMPGSFLDQILQHFFHRVLSLATQTAYRDASRGRANCSA